MSLKRTTPPAAEPITLDQAKLHLRVDHADEDGLITGLITAARLAAEDRLQRTLINSGWTLVLDSFPPVCSRLGNIIQAPMPPLLTVESIQYIDTAGTSQPLASSQYRVDVLGEPGRIQPVTSWPATARQVNAVTVTYTAGYGASAADVPQPIKQWMLLAIGDLYANRSRSAERPQVPHGFADSLLDPYRIWSL